MSQGVNFPTDTAEELSNKHHLCEQEAIQEFLKMSFHDIDQKYCNKLKVRLELGFGGIRPMYTLCSYSIRCVTMRKPIR